MAQRRNIDALLPWIWSACGLLTASVLVFSWLPKPQLAAQIPMPGMLAHWVDDPANENLRTAVPFVLLGFVCSLLLWMKKSGVRIWIIAWQMMVTLAAAAELGQSFIPARCCDVADVGWAAAGAALGLFSVPLAALAWRYRQDFKQKS